LVLTQSGNLAIADILNTRVSRLYAFCGVFLILAGMLLGDIFAVFILHPNNARIGDAVYAAATAIPAGDTDAIMRHFQAVGAFLENRGTKVDAHSHGVAMGYLAVLLAMLQPFVAWSTAAKLRVARAFVVCAITLPIAIFAIHYVGLAYSPLAAIGWASIAADAAGFAIAIIVTIQLMGLWRYWRNDYGTADIERPDTLDRASRILFVGGSVLLVVGFLYGAAYAGYSEYTQSPNEVDILRSIVAGAMERQSLDAEFAAYGGYLAFRGINTAAHAHLNSMAILLLLLALIQPFVLLTDRWKSRWATIMVVAAAALPVSILLELEYGLIAGGMADISGLAAMVALAAMLFGLARKTGAVDSD
jgi:hypothetical protein